MYEKIAEDERIIRSLTFLGLTPEEINAYIYMIFRGMTRIDEIPAAIPFKRINVIEGLKSKKWIEERFTQDGIYYVPIDPYFKLANKIRELESIIDDLKYTLDKLKSIGSFGIIQAFQDSNTFYSKLKMAINSAQNEILFATRYFLLAAKCMNELKKAKRRGIVIKILGELNDENKSIIEELVNSDIEVAINAGNSLRFIIIDMQVFLAVRDPNDYSRHMGVWINSPDFTKPLKETFYSIWRASEKISKGSI